MATIYYVINIFLLCSPCNILFAPNVLRYCNPFEIKKKAIVIIK